MDSADLMDAVDDLNLESDQMDQLYDSLEALNIDISADEMCIRDRYIVFLLSRMIEFWYLRRCILRHDTLSIL